MLPVKIEGTNGPWVVMLHWLGGSGRSWLDVSERLAARGLRCAMVDLPGFGDAVDHEGYDVRSMADAVMETVRGIPLEGAPWLLAGHSMGGKVAAVVARDVLDGKAGLDGLRGLLMVSPSPPGPEPMKEKTREEMMEQLGASSGDAEEDRKRATKFVTDNVGKLSLPETVLERTVNDVLRMNRAAFRAWLTGGSKEDWSGFVGMINLPALVFAGTKEPALGPDAQREHLLPHLPEAKLVAPQGSGHLGPLERADEIAAHVLDFVAALGLEVLPSTRHLSASFEQIVLSEHTSPKTREVMFARLARDAATPASSFDAEVQRTLRALVECVVPDAGFDLTARVEALLASGTTDGTQADALPAGTEAWRVGLLSLDLAAQSEHGVSFLALDQTRRTEVLQQAAQGETGKGLLGTLGLGSGAKAYTAAQMKLWLEEVRGVTVRLFVADPRTLERIGFAGFADDPHGFTQIRLGQPKELVA